MRIADTVIRKPDYITYRELDGEGVLYNTNSKSMHVLNKTALDVWNLCDIEEDPRSMAQVIGKNYSIPEDQVLADVLDCLNRFEELGLIRRVAQ